MENTTQKGSIFLLLGIVIAILLIASGVFILSKYQLTPRGSVAVMPVSSVSPSPVASAHLVQESPEVIGLKDTDPTTISGLGITTSRPSEFYAVIDYKNKRITYHTKIPKVVDNQIIEIYVRDYDPKMSLASWWNSSPDINNGNETFMKLTEVHGFEAIQTHGSGQVDYANYYIPHNAKIYSFLIVETSDSENNARAREVLDNLQFSQ